MRIALLVLLLSAACGGAEAIDPRTELCHTTFCADSAHAVTIVDRPMDLQDGTRLGFLCVCWCPTAAESNRYMVFVSSIPIQPRYAVFFADRWATFCPA